MVRTQYQRFQKVRLERDTLRDTLADVLISLDHLSESVKRGAQGPNWITEELDEIVNRHRALVGLEEE